MNNISADNYYLSPPYTDHAHFDNVIFVLYGLLHFIALALLFEQTNCIDLIDVCYILSLTKKIMVPLPHDTC